jgi:hypothetical protein
VGDVADGQPASDATMKRLASLMLASATVALAGCDATDDGTRTTFALWQCMSSAESRAIDQAVHTAAGELGFEFNRGAIALGGAGTALSLNRDGLQVTVLVMQADNVINVIAAHRENPTELDREAAGKIVSSLPNANCSRVANGSEFATS